MRGTGGSHKLRQSMAMRHGPQRARGARVEPLSATTRGALKAARVAESKGEAGAAEAFAELGRHLDAHPHSAGRLLLRAAALSDGEAVTTLATEALPKLVAGNRPKRAGRLVSQIVDLLKAAERTDDAAALEQAATEALGLDRLAPVSPVPELNRVQRRSLPKACPVCAGKSKPDQLDWDELIPACAYCGTDLG